jgi:hypothetical protein
MLLKVFRAWILIGNRNSKCERNEEAVREIRENVASLKCENEVLENELTMQHLCLDERRQLSMQFDPDFMSTIMSVLDQLRRRTGSDDSASYMIGLHSEVGGLCIGELRYSHEQGACCFLGYGQQLLRQHYPLRPCSLQLVIRRSRRLSPKLLQQQPRRTIQHLCTR